MNKKQIDDYKAQFNPKTVNGRLQTNRHDGTHVEVRNGNIEQALRTMKKKLASSNIIMECRERQAYVTKTEKKKKAKAAAKMRQKREIQRNNIHKKRLY